MDMVDGRSSSVRTERLRYPSDFDAEANFQP